MNCRHCERPLAHCILDLGFAPPSNAYLDRAALTRPEFHLPLKLLVCDGCWLVQTEDYLAASALFRDDYAYFSSVSTTWLEHGRDFAAAIVKRLGLGHRSQVVEVGCNDGYLLANFLAGGIPCLGVEPTASTARAAEARNIPVLRDFFGEVVGARLTNEGRAADLLIVNNVYAHVPDINDFTRGLALALKPAGTITIEFPHLLRLLEESQFDTVYHEHYSYLSLGTVTRILGAHGLRVIDVERLRTHGGSLRVYAKHTQQHDAPSAAVAEVLEAEARYGLERISTYRKLQSSAERIKHDLLLFLIEQRRAGRKLAAYGAAAKGNTLLNYAGVKPDLLPYVCDAAASKQGRFLPGSHLPILEPSQIAVRRPDTILILPWNLTAEVTAQLQFAQEWGAQFWVALPHLQRV